MDSRLIVTKFVARLRRLALWMGDHHQMRSMILGSSKLRERTNHGSDKGLTWQLRCKSEVLELGWEVFWTS